MNYYEVAIGVEKHWDSAVFTYSFEGQLSVGDLVNVPFGRKSKAGYIVRKVAKPSFKTKSLTPYEHVNVSQNTRSFAEWFRQYYAAQGGQALAHFLPHYLTKKTPKNARADKAKASDVHLNSQQQTAVKQLTEDAKPSVLHGITGSGKTRLYLSLVLDTLKTGKNALLLYPEISLTSQLLKEIRTHAPVLAFHSALTDAQRSKLWFRVATATEPLVVIGPRSALFLPYSNLGLIVVDEAHESSYKQENDIHYNGLLVAGGLAQAHDARLVFGSATPPITETELILRGGGPLVCMHELAITNNHTKSVHIIDRKDRTQFKKHSLLSDALLTSIETSLAHNKQSLLFINRRGTAKLTLCEHCGWQAECPDCELPLTYHHDVHTLICHTCGKQAAIESTCPQCSQQTTLKSFGSKAIVDEVQALFPHARIARFDTDTHKDESFHAMYNDISAGAVDILIGTQQIAKGLDLPLLETVGILDADLSLHFPDYSSDERTFQLISQVAGRTGRGHGKGTVYVQTLHPKNEVIRLATKEDWHGFRDRELLQRQAHTFPPYTYAAKVIFRHKSFPTAMKKAEDTKRLLTQLKTDTIIDGPLPAFHYKRSGHYYVHLHLKNRSRRSLLTAIKRISEDVILDLDPTTLL